MAEEIIASPPTPAKFSRYRSVRKQAIPANPPPTSPAQKSEDAPVSRSMSRYRRPRTAVSTDDHATSSQYRPPVPSIPRTHDFSNNVRPVTEPGSDAQRTTADERRDQEARQRRVAKEQKLRGEQQRAEAEADQVRLAEEKLAEQKQKDLERLESELDAAAPTLKNSSSSKEIFSFFTRKRRATHVTTASGSGSTSDGQREYSPIYKQVGNGPPISEPRKKSDDPTPRAAEPGSGAAALGIDAPVSAVNAGERRVLIRCKQTSINLPITPETTPADLVYSAANIINQAIDPSTAILLESYTQLGLERRIRRYEHIRDVMNSWDRDTQNALILQNSDTPKHDHDLAAAFVPREAPPSVSIHMFYSQKPGKWNKRYITLLSSGQIYVAKKHGAKMSDKDVATICHLSDFDIYTPTPQQLRKHLRPPKKYCHAIKSQQKTTMFLSTENFVHFFCTDEPHMAEQWYAAVQEWRSWYLVNKLGEGKKTTGKSTTELKVPVRVGSTARATHKVKVSVDENPYTIGSFTPLLNLNRFEAPSKAEPEHDSDDENRPRQIPFHLRHSVSQPSIPPKTEQHPPPVAYRLPPEPEEEEFATSGLLGRSYTQRQRQRQHKDREVNTQLPQLFSEGPSLLDNSKPPPTRTHHRSLSTNSIAHPQNFAGPSSNGLQRNVSKREKPKPLLDFTPQFKEAPQWDMTGKGHGVAPPVGVPLVDVATTPENVLADVPKATILRRDPTVRRPQTAAGRGKNQESPFVKGGLVSGI